MKDGVHNSSTKNRRWHHASAVISACLVMVFALIFGVSSLIHHSQPQQNSPAPIDDSVNTNTFDSEKDNEDSARSDSGDDAGYVQGEILVAIEPGASVENINEALASYDFVVTKDVSDQNLDAGFVVIELAEGANAEHSATTLSLSGLRAQPNFVYTIAEGNDADPLATLLAASSSNEESDNPQAQAAATVNDPEHGKQWALDSIDAYRAWGIEKCDDRGENRVSIAVIDTGVDIDHEDLVPNLRATYLTEVNDRGTVTRAGSTERSDVDDKNGHGTHVSGIAAGATNNSTGIAGISYNAGLVAIKATTSEAGQDFTTATLADGYNWLFAQRPDGSTNAEYYNVRVVNMSVGGYSRGGLNRDDVLARKIKEAHAGKSGDKSFPSIITVAAAGNSGTKDNAGNVVPIPFGVMPGDYEYCLTVMNLARDTGWSPSNNVLTLSATSNYNTPGNRLKNISAPGTGILNTVNTGDYEEKSGTSMATPCVAGIAALVLSENPSLNASQVTDIIETTADDIEAQGWDEKTGYGAVDAYHALQVTSATLGGEATVSYKGSSSIAVTYGDGSGWETNGSPNDWDWAVDDESVIELKTSDDGQSVSITGKKLGTATVTATLKDADGNANTGIALTKKITVTKLDLAKANVVVTGSYEYTGSAISPTPIVSYGGSQLEPNVDYRVSYENNVNASTSSSAPAVIVSGIGSCTGSARANFAISPTSLASATLGSLGSYSYTGGEITPIPSVTLGSFGTLVEGTDFTCEYKDNQNAEGDAGVRVVGKGNFTGTSNWRSFTISRCSLSKATIGVANQSYTGHEVKPNPSVTINGKTLVNGRDYHITGYANNTAPGTAEVTIEGVNNYEGTRRATFTITASISKSTITVNETPAYTGAALKPRITVRDGSAVLSEGTDYTVRYGNNVNAGTNTGTIEVTGRGKYAGTIRASFSIRQQTLANASIEIPSQTYTGGLIEPAPTVTLSGYGTLVKGKDYTVVYSNNVNVGTASATIIGTGNFTGSAKTSFAIAAASTPAPAPTPSTPDTSGIPMYRLYNPNSGEHFYTASAGERDSLSYVGWRYEGVGWTAPSSSNTPVYRLYSGTDHHYTTSAAERDSLVRTGWKYEGIGWYSDDQMRTPLYRQFNPNVNPNASRNNSGSHNYTTNLAEHNQLVSVGWHDEGIGWYGM